MLFVADIFRDETTLSVELLQTLQATRAQLSFNQAISKADSCFMAGDFALSSDFFTLAFRAPDAADRQERVAVDGRDAGVGDLGAGLPAVCRKRRQLEVIAAFQGGLLEALRRAVGAARGVVGDHEGNMVFGRGLLPGDAVHARRVQEILLVGGGVVADLAAAGARLPACARADGVPAFFVVVAFVFRVHEAVVEQAEAEGHQLVVVHDRGAVGGVDRDEPGNVQHIVHVGQELLLVGVGREIDARIEHRAEDMVFAPVAEAQLQEGDAGILAVARVEVGVELLRERRRTAW